MEIKETEYYIEAISFDGNGEFKVRIQKDGSQLQIETGINDAFIDIDYKELKIIRGIINKVIECIDKNKL